MFLYFGWMDSEIPKCLVTREMPTPSPPPELSVGDTDPACCDPGLMPDLYQMYL